MKFLLTPAGKLLFVGCPRANGLMPFLDLFLFQPCPKFTL